LRTLEKVPSRKTKCPHCGKSVVVRRGVLMTEQDAADADLLRRWLRPLDQFGATEEKFSQARADLTKQFGTEASIRDSIWRTMNLLVAESRATEKLERIYLLMGQFVAEEGKDPSPYVEQAMEVKSSSIRREVTRLSRLIDETEFTVTIHTCNDEYVCESCRKAAQRNYGNEEFLELLPIPTVCTSSHGCRCWINAKIV
jgi:hypothetical protein